MSLAYDKEIIQIKNLSKTFDSKDGSFEAIKDISLSIDKGTIYGIIGMSGAGKSTLVRCLNFLEKPTKGTVIIEGEDLSLLKDFDLREKRRDCSMIFQHFNLLMQKNVLDNVCFPLTIWGMPKKRAILRAREILEIVGLSDKEKAYPAQLSGGQKQRVAIARALAGKPKILLCDEATSALDPQTTKAILALLKKINAEFGITIVIITHEMAVVREICTHVAIIDEGNLIEHGEVIDIFSHPKTKEAKKLIYGEGKEKITWSDTDSDGKPRLLKGGRVIRIVFTENSSFEPVIGNMVLDSGHPVNILYANTKNVSGTARGEMLLGLPRDDEQANKMIAYLNSRGLAVEEVADYVE